MITELFNRIKFLSVIVRTDYSQFSKRSYFTVKSSANRFNFYFIYNCDKRVWKISFLFTPECKQLCATKEKYNLNVQASVEWRQVEKF